MWGPDRDGAEEVQSKGQEGRKEGEGLVMSSVSHSHGNVFNRMSGVKF